MAIKRAEMNEIALANRAADWRRLKALVLDSTRVKGAKSIGVRVGNWLSVQQAQKLLNAPDVTTKKGLRDRAMLAILLGCGLRRSEVAALTLKHIQQRDNRWCIVDLVGKHEEVTA
jgi:site-specific recombinase XerD